MSIYRNQRLNHGIWAIHDDLAHRLLPFPIAARCAPKGGRLMSLRWFHMLFILLVIVSADMFGAWGLWNYYHGGGNQPLLLGIGGLIAGIGLACYVPWMVNKLDHAHIY